MTNAALQVKQALIEAAVAAIDDPSVMVCNGNPGQYQPDDIVSFGRVTWSEAPGPISTRRVRELTVQVYAIVSVYRGGGPEQEQVCEDRCFELADLIGDYLRTDDHTKLGGAAMWCFRTAADRPDSDPNLSSSGRVVEVTVEFTAVTRIPNVP